MCHFYKKNTALTPGYNLDSMPIWSSTKMCLLFSIVTTLFTHSTRYWQEKRQDCWRKSTTKITPERNLGVVCRSQISTWSLTLLIWRIQNISPFTKMIMKFQMLQPLSHYNGFEGMDEQRMPYSKSVIIQHSSLDVRFIRYMYVYVRWCPGYPLWVFCMFKIASVCVLRWQITNGRTYNGQNNR